VKIGRPDKWERPAIKWKGRERDEQWYQHDTFRVFTLQQSGPGGE